MRIGYSMSASGAVAARPVSASQIRTETTGIGWEAGWQLKRTNLVQA